MLWSAPMILNAIAEKLKHPSKDDFKGRHFECMAGRAGGDLVPSLSTRTFADNTAPA
jgi:hypothetical protein